MIRLVVLRPLGCEDAQRVQFSTRYGMMGCHGNFEVATTIQFMRHGADKFVNFYLRLRD